jgi:hypothetical protein
MVDTNEDVVYGKNEDVVYRKILIRANKADDSNLGGYVENVKTNF